MTLVAPHPPTHRPAPAPAGRADPPQYSLRKIMAVWAAAALPMAFLAWVVAPWLADGFDGPHQLVKALLTCMTAGLIWQFVLVVVLVAREQGSLRPSRVRHALWLQSPRSPRSGRRGGRLWLLVIPLAVGFGAEEFLQVFEAVTCRDMAAFLESETGQGFLSGAWGWFAVIATLGIFNTVLGEELLFRGLLLPRMNGVFGRRDWVANGVLFACYHLHMPWAIPTTLLDTFFISYPSRRYRSALIGIAVHSSQTVVLLGVVLALVVG